MATVTFPDDLGGDGLTVTDDANPDTGLAAGGHRLRFVPALNNTVAMARTAADQAAAAKQSETAAAASRSAAKSSETRAANSASAASSSQRASADSAKAAARSADSVDADQIMHKRGSGLANEVGTAATRNVGTADGELMEVGAWGFGGVAPVVDSLMGSDFNTQIDRSFYGTTTGIWKNGPLGDNGHTGIIEQVRRAFSNMIIQAWIEYGTGRRFERIINPDGDSKTEWGLIISNKTAIGPITRDPPSAIIESGANSNGRYIKYADGTAIARVSFFELTEDAGTIGSNRVKQGFWTLPVRAISSESCVPMVIFADGADFGGREIRYEDMCYARAYPSGGGATVVAQIGDLQKRDLADYTPRVHLTATYNWR